MMRSLPAVAVLSLLLGACASQDVVVNTPTTPPPSGFVSQPNTPAPTSANTVQRVPLGPSAVDTLGRPGWLNKRISVLSAPAAAGGPTRRVRIYRSRFDGETVFFETAAGPGQFSTLYSLRGQVLCRPDGGPDGKGDGRCGDFRKRRTDEVLVWQGK